MKRRIKRFLCIVMVASMICGCLVVNAAATAIPENAVIQRASGSFKTTVAPGVVAKGTTTLPLEAKETVTIKASYTPYPISVDVGLVDEDGIFHYTTVTNGIIDVTISITERGNYLFGIRNNGTEEIEVSGYIKY